MNGRPVVPTLNTEGILPKFLPTRRLESAVPPNSRLKIFSGTANPTLAEVSEHDVGIT